MNTEKPNLRIHHGTGAVALWIAACLIIGCTASLFSQPYGDPDRDAPGDEMIQEYLRSETEKIEAEWLGDIRSADEWEEARPRFLEEYFDMLGLWPVPETTPLHATITRTLEKEDYVVEMLHYQSMPGLYVTANLYRPRQLEPGRKLPAIFYVCGHSPRGRDGNKTAYQSHGIWFARNGYICLVVDTLQMGEIAGIHHGTYREERWWWISRGYTPAAVEAWNGIRGIDYLLTRPDVDPDRIGVTGISGGGAATFWIAAADERVAAAAPVSGMADLLSYVPNRVINGHCDCMFLYNTYEWPWARIAALIAPRPLLFVNSDRDPIFPMDANERVINRLERVYSLFGAGDRVAAVVSMGGHSYRKDIRQAVYRFMNTYLKNDPRWVEDSELDLVTGARAEDHPIAPRQLRVFPEDSDIPQDALNGRIDQTFVPMGSSEPPGRDDFADWKTDRLADLRRLSFPNFPERIPPAKPVRERGGEWLATEPGISVRIRGATAPEDPARVLLYVSEADLETPLPDWVKQAVTRGDAVYVLEPRGIGATAWTRRNPPNYVERSHLLLGRTVAGGRVWDIVAAARYLEELHGVPVHLLGRNAAAVLAIYAALFDPDISGLLLHQPPASHMEASAPGLLHVLRVGDIPEALGMVAPRPVTLTASDVAPFETSSAIYDAAGASDRLLLNP